MTAIVATWEAEIRRITVQGQPKQIVYKTPISKITKLKWTGGVAQVVEYLLCKCKAPVPPKENKKNHIEYFASVQTQTSSSSSSSGAVCSLSLDI
jgi:hypothetical protein